MLFIISSNNKAGEDTLTGSANIETLTGAEKEDLDNLVDMIDGEENEVSEEENEQADETQENSSQEVITDDADNAEAQTQEDTQEEKEGFFSKMFGGKSENTQEVNEEITDEVSENYTATQENLVKDTKETQISSETAYAVQTYAPEIYAQPISYPGENIETQVGKEYEIWVHSLKLNNKYFNETLGYMMKGDRIVQLGEENAYGCFEVEILAAENTDNIGKVGYVCKKYLSDTNASTQQEVSQENVAKNPSMSLTNVGDVITVEKDFTMSNGIVLSVGDTIDQMTPATEDGCFTAHILTAKIYPYVVPVGDLCLSDIK